MMPDISISYFPKGQSKEIAKDIAYAFEKNGVSDIFGITQPKYKDSKQERIQKIAQSKCVVLVICDHYLSQHQDELLEIYNDDSFEERIFPVVLNGVELRNSHYLINHLKGLETEIEQLETAMRQVGLHGQASIQKELNLLVKKRSCLSEIINTFKQIYIPEIESLIESGYTEVIEAVSERLNEINIPKPTTTNHFTDSKIFECNRSKQRKNFYDYRKESKKVQAFFIHGDEWHGHEQLFERFCNELNYRHLSSRGNGNTVKQFTISVEAIDSSEFREQLSMALFIKLMSKSAPNPKSCQIRNRNLPKNISEACEQCNTIKKLTKHDIVAVRVKISNPEHIHSIIENVRYFLDNTCSDKLLPPNAPQFYFFFSLEYDYAPKRNFIKKLFLRSYKKKIKETLEKNGQIPVIDELTWINDNDIDKWLKSIDIRPEIRQEIIRDEFSPRKKKQGYYMRDLMSSFKKIIENYEKYAYAKS